MKVKILLRLLMLLLWVTLGFACKNNTETNAASLSFAAAIPANHPASESVSIPEEIPTATVYWCKSTGAKKYHLSNTCRGLSNCKHEIVKIEKKDAENRGLGLCGWED